jgi:hypothetical protein
MTYKTAEKLNESFNIDAEYNIKYNNATLSDPLCKGYVYANLFFFDEVQKEIVKLHTMVEGIYNEVVAELGADPNDVIKLLFELSTRANRRIGDDGLDSIIKEFLSTKHRHLALMVDAREKLKFLQICEAIFAEIVTAFYTMTLHQAGDLEGGVKIFKFTRDYINDLTERQKAFLAPAIRVVALQQQITLNDLTISQDWTVKYTPDIAHVPYVKQEETIRDQIKTFAQSAGQ